nr:hypothetical protein [Tanacetum cinerariifolium]
MGKGEDVGDDLNGGVGSAIYRVKEAFVPMFSSWLRLRAGERHFRDVWFDLYMAVFGQPTSVLVKWLPFTNHNSNEAQTSKHVLVHMTYLIACMTLESANSCAMQGASCTQMNVYVVSFSSISSDSFLPSIMLLVVIMAIVGVVIVVVIIGIVVVVGGVSSILKLLSVIIGFEAVKFPSILLEVPLGLVFLLGLLVFSMVAACASQATAIPLAINCQMSGGGVINLTSDEDPTDEDGDAKMDDSTGVFASLDCEISSRGKKSGKSYSDNKGGITVGEAIKACSGGIFNSLVASYACMTSIYGSSFKGEKTSVAKDT